MGVLSLHNECPPLELGPDVKAICSGLVMGEEATGGMLRALSDCLAAMSAMDDTVAALVSGWTAAMDGGEGGPGCDVHQAYARSFELLEGTVDRIEASIRRHHDLKTYGRGAAEAGRGRAYLAALQQTSGSDFASLVDRRVEGLRLLKVRVRLLQHLRPVGARALEAGDSSEFFLVLMQPIRDLAIAIQALYAEVVSGARASHEALFRSCRLLGEGDPPLVEAAPAEPALAVAVAGAGAPEPAVPVLA